MESSNSKLVALIITHYYLYSRIIAKPLPIEVAETDTPVIKTQLPSLVLFVTSVMLEYAHSDYEISSSMFAGIKCQDDRAGERGARPEWAWEFWQNDWVFREDSEVWGECVDHG
jgi:hypothetical protein